MEAQTPPQNRETLDVASSTSPNPTTKSTSMSSHDVINQMPDFPSRTNPLHRRAHSEIISLPDDLDSFDDPTDFLAGPTDYDYGYNENDDDDVLAMYLDMDKIKIGAGGEDNGAVSGSGASSSAGSGRARHQHSQSIDGSEMHIGSSSSVVADAKKAAMTDAKLADLALVDPKRAKRIWANRQSAARSKERKMRYIGELERKVQTLQAESTTLSAQLAMLQRDTTGLSADNSELKMRVQTMEQQVHLQDAMNDALREEVQRLKLATGQMMQNGPMMNFGQSSFGTNQQFHNQHQHSHNNRNQNQGMQSLLTAQQQQQQQQQLQMRQQQMQHQNQLFQQQRQQMNRRTLSPQNLRENNNTSL